MTLLIQVVEVFMDKLDYPWRVMTQVDLANDRASRNARKRKQEREN